MDTTPDITNDTAPAPSGAKVDLTQGPITGHVFRMLGPFAVAVIALLSAGIIDTIYLGNLSTEGYLGWLPFFDGHIVDTTRDLGVGEDGEPLSLGVVALAAIGIGYPLTFLGNSANIGLGAGTMSAVSRATGQGESAKARRYAASAILFALMVMTLLTAMMMLAMPFVVRIMGAQGQVLTLALQYLAISLPGLVIVSVANVGNNILRAGGEAALPSLIMILGAVINILLDPFLIFGIGPFPQLEVQGAALATVIGNTIAAAFAFYILQIRRRAVDFVGMTWTTLKAAWWRVGSVGIPAAGTNMVVPIGTAIAVGAVQNMLGTQANAAFTLTSRSELIAVGLLYALSACIGAITGQNGGAGRTDRVRETFITCYTICLVWGTVMAGVLYIFRGPIVSVFTSDPVVIDMALPYFAIVPITIFAYGFVFISAAGFNALGRPLFGLTYTILRSLVLYAPLVALGAWTHGLVGAFVGVAVANLLSGAVAAWWSLKRAPMRAQNS